MTAKEFLVTLNVPPSIEEAIVDFLLTFESEHGFTSFQVSAHDHINQNLSIAEQVAGRQDQLRFQMYIPELALPELLKKLKDEFSNSGIHYWVLPVIEHDHL